MKYYSHKCTAWITVDTDIIVFHFEDKAVNYLCLANNPVASPPVERYKRSNGAL